MTYSDSAMKKFLLLLLALVPLVVPPAPAETGDQGLSAEGVWTRFAERSASIKTWSADYRQIRVLSAFENPILSNGKLHVLYPCRLRWERESPNKAVITVNGRDALIHVRESRKARKFAFPEHWSPEKLLSPNVEWKKRTTELFEVKMMDSKQDRVAIRLTPREKELKLTVKSVNLTVSRANWTLLSLRIEKPSGEYVRIEFTEHEIGPALTRPFFEFVPPEGSEITTLEEAPDFFAELAGAEP